MVGPDMSVCDEMVESSEGSLSDEIEAATVVMVGGVEEVERELSILISEIARSGFGRCGASARAVVVCLVFPDAR